MRYQNLLLKCTYRALALQRQKIQSYQETTLGRYQQIAQMAKRSYEIGQSETTSVLLAQQENVDVRNGCCKRLRNFLYRLGAICRRRFLLDQSLHYKRSENEQPN